MYDPQSVGVTPKSGHSAGSATTNTTLVSLGIAIGTHFRAPPFWYSPLYGGPNIMSPGDQKVKINKQKKSFRFLIYHFYTFQLRSGI